MEGNKQFLPRPVVAKIPPVKTQGIKTKLVSLIAESIKWPGNGRWIEPFLGSGVVAFNIAPAQALLADTNEYIINLYLGIGAGAIDGAAVRRHLEREGSLLLKRGEEHYYAVRKRFNAGGDPLDFVFLNRACFNGMVRFNSKGEFNVPFCRKPNRFRPALITKIVNQIEWVGAAMKGKDWQFVAQDWRTTIADAGPQDMIYCDPPYVGRHTDYYNNFSDDEADELARALTSTSASFALSMWLENKYRRNSYVDRWFADFPQRPVSHFYHLGSHESLRNQMTEVVILSGKSAAGQSVPPLYRRQPVPERLC